MIERLRAKIKQALCSHSLVLTSEVYGYSANGSPMIERTHRCAYCGKSGVYPPQRTDWDMQARRDSEALSWLDHNRPKDLKMKGLMDDDGKIHWVYRT